VLGLTLAGLALTSLLVSRQRRLKDERCRRYRPNFRLFDSCKYYGRDGENREW